MEKERVKYYDNIRGILILLVVLGHFLFNIKDNGSLFSIVIKTIYLFHMPMFVFISGFFSKSIFNKKKCFKYLFYYIIMNTIIMTYSILIEGNQASLLIPYYSMWYLIALIIWRKTAKCFGNIKGIITISIIISFLIGFCTEVTNAFALSRIISFYPFFIIGFKLRQSTIEELFIRKDKYKLIIGYILLILLSVLSIKIVPSINFNEFLMEPYESYNNVFNRLIIFFMASCFMFAILLIVSNKRIIGITRFGEKSFYIYLFHRITILVISLFYNSSKNSLVTLIILLLSSIAICILFSSNLISKYTDKIYEIVYTSLEEHKMKTERYFIKGVAICIIMFTISTAGVIPWIRDRKNSNFNIEENEDIKYEVLSDYEKERIDNSFSILFTGDLILLKEQVKRGYDEKTNKYSFEDIFEYTKNYIKDSNLSIGVFEGPMASEEKGFSNSDFDDNTQLYLNYPDEFGEAVKNAGFDLVTLANNHMLDKGKEGLNRTIDVLDNLGLTHTGGYKTEEDRDNINLIEKDGMKIGVLSYTYGCNYHNEEELIEEKTIPLLVDKSSKNYNSIKSIVENDFEKLRSKNPDIIIVIPHMGTQFSTETDEFQESWNKVFIDLGADVILGDHAHTVQPLEIRKNKNDEDVLIVNCPGNFVNSYTENNGDATAMVEVYIEKNTGKIIGSSIIPMWVQSRINGNYRAIPMYELAKNENLRNEISTYELDKAEEVCKFITRIMINKEIKMDMIQDKMYFMSDGYKRQKTEKIDLNMRSKIVKEIYNADSVCFIGDSLTKGTKNGGYGWYEPLINSFNNKRISNISKGGATIKTITDEYLKNKIQADLYIIAIGANDIRYRDSSICAMNENEYTSEIDKLIENISNNSKARFVLIAPWISTSDDIDNCKVSQEEKKELYYNYTTKLEQFCDEKGYIFINPNVIIEDTLNRELSDKYLIDYIHPNVMNGIRLYSEAVMNSSEIKN